MEDIPKQSSAENLHNEYNLIVPTPAILGNKGIRHQISLKLNRDVLNTLPSQLIRMVLRIVIVWLSKPPTNYTQAAKDRKQRGSRGSQCPWSAGAEWDVIECNGMVCDAMESTRRGRRRRRGAGTKEGGRKEEGRRKEAQCVKDSKLGTKLIDTGPRVHMTGQAEAGPARGKRRAGPGRGWHTAYTRLPLNKQK